MVTMSFGNAVRRQRRPNFSHAEVKILIDCVEEIPELNTNEMGQGKRFEKPADIRVAWDLVAQKVSNVGTTVRGLKEVRDKWLDLKCRIKKKASSLNNPSGTGGVRRTPLTYLEQRMLKFISPSFTMGIVGGVSSLEDFFEVEEEGETMKELFPVEVKKEIIDDPESYDGESSVLPDFPAEDNDSMASGPVGDLQCSSVSKDKESAFQELTPVTEVENTLPGKESSFHVQQLIAVTTGENGLPDKESEAAEQDLGNILEKNILTGSSDSEPKKATKRKYSKVSSATLEEKLDILIRRKSEKNEILKDIKSVLTQFLFVQQDMLATQEEINCSLKTLLRNKSDQKSKQ